MEGLTDFSHNGTKIGSGRVNFFPQTRLTGSGRVYFLKLDPTSGSGRVDQKAADPSGRVDRVNGLSPALSGALQRGQNETPGNQNLRYFVVSWSVCWLGPVELEGFVFASQAADELVSDRRSNIARPAFEISDSISI